MKTITIIVPAYNEEEALPYFFDRIKNVVDDIKNYNFEILFINDGSKDKTLEIIKKYKEKENRISYVNLSRNFGKEVAMIAGLDYAKGDAIVFMDADLQDPPELIPELIKWWEEGYDDVYAKRKTRAGETWLKKFTSKMYYKVLQSLTNVQIQKDMLTTAPPVASAAKSTKMTLLIMSTRETPEIAASPTEETMMPSHMPTRVARVCSMTRGKISRISF